MVQKVTDPTGSAARGLPKTTLVCYPWTFKDGSEMPDGYSIPEDRREYWARYLETLYEQSMEWSRRLKAVVEAIVPDTPPGD